MLNFSRNGPCQTKGLLTNYSTLARPEMKHAEIGGEVYASWVTTVNTYMKTWSTMIWWVSHLFYRLVTQYLVDPWIPQNSAIGPGGGASPASTVAHPK